MQLATLHHNDDFKTFYSANALKMALAEAQAGDIINLSAGTFLSCEITVPVTIRGAGIGLVDNMDNSTGLRTTITGDLNINIPENDEGKSLSMEGIVCDNIIIDSATNPLFCKMKFTKLSAKNYQTSKFNNLTLFHCVLETIEGANYGTAQVYNSVITRPYIRDFNYGHLSIINSTLIEFPSQMDGGLSSSYIDYTNCVFDQSKKQEGFSGSGAKLYYCLFVGSDKNPLDGDNLAATNHNNVMPAEKQAFIEDSFYRLTKDAASYLGNDGTQVGIYGTSMPFTVKTSYPQIKKFVVAPESSVDGKLSIDLEIDVVE